MEKNISELKKYTELESFENKKKFPDILRPLLLASAKEAILNKEHDDNFYSHIMKFLPYNMFTLKVIFLIDRNWLNV